MSITSMLQKNLHTRGFECTLLSAGQMARVNVDGKEKSVIESEAWVGNLEDTASDFQIAARLLGSLLVFRRHGDRYVTLREVVVHKLSDGKRLAVTTVGFI